MPRGSGRRPGPTALKKLRGNPGKRKLNENEPQAKPGRPPLPPGLTDVAQAEWDRMVPELEAIGVLSTIDGSALAAYCQAYSRWLQAEAEIDAHGITLVTKHETEKGLVDGDIKKNPAVTVANDAMKLMRAFLSEFGMTPSSRSRIKASLSNQPVDEFEEFLRKGELLR